MNRTKSKTQRRTLVPVLFAGLLAVCSTAHAANDSLPAIPRPVIPNNTFTITDYGAVPDGITLNTDAIARTIDACEKAGGGTVIIPPGKFLTAALALTSNLNLHLEKGATILFSNKFSDYTLSEKGYPNLITAINVHDLAITGEGTIDGQGQPWWDEFLKTKGTPPEVEKMPHRPFMVVLRGCTRLLVQGITLTNSPSFHLVPSASRDVRIDNVKFISPEKAPNTDGLDPSGWNWLVTNCTFDVGDDCIAIKPSGASTDDHLSVEDFYVANCKFKHGHGMSIGGQTPGGLRHLVVRDCTFENTDAGIRMKANRGAGGLVEDCLYENLTMKNVKVPIYITSYYPERGTPKDPSTDKGEPVNKTTPIWRNIRINNVTAEGSPTAGKIVGLPELPVSDVTLTNVKISAEKGMTIWNTEGVRFVNSQVTAQKEPALDIRQSSDVTGLNPKTGRPE